MSDELSFLLDWQPPDDIPLADSYIEPLPIEVCYVLG